MSLSAIRAIALATIGAAFVVRLPGLAQPLGIDQGIFATCGWALSRGFALYRDVWDQKPPGIHLTYLIGFQLLGESAAAVFWLDYGASLATCLLVGMIAARLSTPSAGWIAAALYAVGTVPAYAWRYGGFLERAVPETFAPLFLCLSVLPVLRPGPGMRAIVLSGLGIGIAALFKPTMALVGAGLLLWICIRLTWRQRLMTTLAFSAGVAVPLAAVAAWLGAQGALDDAFVAVVGYNRSYVAIGFNWSTYPRALADAVWLRMRSEPLWMIGGVALTYDLVQSLKNRQLDGPAALRAVWASAAMIALAANGARLYNPYFMPLSVPLALAGGALIAGAIAAVKTSRVTLAIAVVLMAITLPKHAQFSRWRTATAADMSAFLSDGPEGRTEYLGRFGSYGQGRGFSARANTELADYIRSSTAPSDRIYIFGMAAGVYFESGRLPAHRFIWSSPVVFELFDHPDFALGSLIAEIERAAPAIIVFELNTRDSLQNRTGDVLLEDPEFKRLMTPYAEEARIDDFLVFRRR